MVLKITNPLDVLKMGIFMYFLKTLKNEYQSKKNKRVKNEYL